MKTYMLVITLITISIAGWLFVNNAPNPTNLKKTIAKQEANSIEASRVFADVKPSVFKNKTAKTAEIDEKSHTNIVVSKIGTASVGQEPQLAAISHERDKARAEAFNEESATGNAAEPAQAQLPENWGTITQAVLKEPDPALRGEAIQTLSLYRNKEVVGILTEASTVDPDAFNRAKAVQALWHAAADNPKAMADIKSQLEKSSNDPDPAVSTLAAKAVADLDRLGKQQPQLN